MSQKRVASDTMRLHAIDDRNIVTMQISLTSVRGKVAAQAGDADKVHVDLSTPPPHSTSPSAHHCQPHWTRSIPPPLAVPESPPDAKAHTLTLKTSPTALHSTGGSVHAGRTLASSPPTIVGLDSPARAHVTPPVPSPTQLAAAMAGSPMAFRASPSKPSPPSPAHLTGSRPSSTATTTPRVPASPKH